MIRFYAPDIEETHSLPADDSQHCVRVLRMRSGDEVHVVDGRGHVYECTLVDANPREATLQIDNVIEEQPAWDYEITLAVAPTKNPQRTEWMVEKLVEMGVNRIVPFVSERSERHGIKEARLEKIVVSAMKQSLKATLPVLEPLTPLKKVVEETRTQERYICYCDAETPRQLLSRAYAAGSDVTILIGPEGDFSPAEVVHAIDHGFKPVTLGDTRLRTETAALAACETIHVVNQLK